MGPLLYLSCLILWKYFFLKKIKPTFIPAIVWLFISTILLTIPGSAFPKENWLSKIWFDKWVHIGMFALMVFLWCWAIHNKQTVQLKLSNTFLWIGIFCLLYGVVMEFVQEYVVINRSFDVGDIIADAAGCLIGVVYSLKRYKKN
ncbi:hypothetical protein CAP36_17360 [Chitinophagaceae bacterium IBVUCB2]|nr:hypothetical protein CAP36_17360 [Chitinophagaceae bacterium IBVUCB2]